MELFRHLPLAITFLLLPLAAWIALRLPSPWRLRAFAAVNLLGLVPLCILAGAHDIRRQQLPAFLKAALFVVVAYVAGTIFHYFLLRRWGRAANWTKWIPFWYPIFLLILFKYVPGGWLTYFEQRPPVEILLGLSYLAFRLSYLSTEIQNQVVEMPSLSEYLAFSFFLPTLSVGPISRFSQFHASLVAPDRTQTPVAESWLRILTGLTKYLFFASLLNQLTYQGLLLDGNPHHPIDLFIAAAAFFAYLYCNFSGWCDMSIGVAGLLGIRIIENFDRPFQARNFQEFWNRWHISLSTYMRDVMFSPLSKELVRKWGPQNLNHAIGFSIFCVFLVMGIWHGAGWNFVVYGLLQGAGVTAVHYYTVALKKRLGGRGYKAYLANPYIRTASTVLTWSYMAFCLFFFANNWNNTRKIFDAIRW